MAATVCASPERLRNGKIIGQSVDTGTIYTKSGWVEYSIVGEGTPVLFVHGGHSNSKDLLFQKGWDQKKYQMITPSRPGYGNTPLANHQTPKAAADLFVALLDALRINEVIVYGISAGGWTALELAAKYPERVEKLILVSAVTKAWLDPKEKTYQAAKRIFDPKIEWISWGLVHLFARLTPYLLAKRFHAEFSSFKEAIITQKEVEELSNALKKYRSKAGFVNDIDQGIDPAVLKKIRCPTLILHSRHDASVSPAHATHAHREIQGSQLHMLENKWGHMLCLGDEYQEVLSIIHRFLDENQSTSYK